MKNQKTYTLLFLAITSLFLTSCQKQPMADFSSDKTQYVAGDDIVLTNTSTDGEIYKWTMPDGQTASAANLTYTTSSTMDDGTLTFRLEATSKNGKKRDEVSKTFNVKAATGQITVWTKNCSFKPITVTINGISEGTVSSCYTSEPSCGASGCVSKTLKVGTYKVKAENPDYIWSESTFKITKNGCFTYELY